MSRRGGPSRRSEQADSIVVDPHKHGLQPYGCGCVLFRDPAVGRFYKHDSPYTYFTSKELHLGEISLECSRAGAAAVALWATQRLLPLTPGGEFARGLAKGRRAALELDRRVRGDGRFVALAAARRNWILWCGHCARRLMSRHRNGAQRVFDAWCFGLRQRRAIRNYFCHRRNSGKNWRGQLAKFAKSLRRQYQS